MDDKQREEYSYKKWAETSKTMTKEELQKILKDAQKRIDSLQEFINKNNDTINRLKKVNKSFYATQMTGREYIDEVLNKKRRAAIKLTFASLFVLCYLSIFCAFFYANRDTDKPAKS